MLFQELGLSQYLSKLSDRGLGTWEALSSVSIEELRNGLGMLPGHARLLHKRLQAKKDALAPPTVQAAAAPLLAPGLVQLPAKVVHPRSSTLPVPPLVAPSAPVGSPQPPLPPPLGGLPQVPMQVLGGMSLPAATMLTPLPVLPSVLPPVPTVPVPTALPGVPGAPLVQQASVAHQQASAAMHSVVGEALTFMKTIMGEKDDDPLPSPPESHGPSAFDQAELMRRILAARAASTSPAEGDAAERAAGGTPEALLGSAPSIGSFIGAAEVIPNGHQAAEGRSRSQDVSKVSRDGAEAKKKRSRSRERRRRRSSSRAAKGSRSRSRDRGRGRRKPATDTGAPPSGGRMLSLGQLIRGLSSSLAAGGTLSAGGAGAGAATGSAGGAIS